MNWHVLTKQGEGRSRAGYPEPRLAAELWLAATFAHELRGIHGRNVLREWASKWNRERFTPSKLEAPRCAGDLGPRARRRAMAGERSYA